MDHPFYLVGRGRRWVIVYINANSYLLAQVGEVHGKGGAVTMLDIPGGGNIVVKEF